MIQTDENYIEYDEYVNIWEQHKYIFPKRVAYVESVDDKYVKGFYWHYTTSHKSGFKMLKQTFNARFIQWDA